MKAKELTSVIKKAEYIGIEFHVIPMSEGEYSMEFKNNNNAVSVTFLCQGAALEYLNEKQRELNRRKARGTLAKK